MVGLDIQDEMGRHEVGHIDNSMKIPLNNGDGCRFEGHFSINKVRALTVGEGVLAGEMLTGSICENENLEICVSPAVCVFMTLIRQKFNSVWGEESAWPDPQGMC